MSDEVRDEVRAEKVRKAVKAVNQSGKTFSKAFRGHGVCYHTMKRWVGEAGYVAVTVLVPKSELREFRERL